MLTSANPSPPVITYGNIQDAVAGGIRDMILRGHLKPGDRLRQDELADTFGVSTMPTQQYRLYFCSLPELGPPRLANYRRIYQACRDRDPEALLDAFRIIWGQRDHMLIPLVREEESKRQTT